MHNSPLLCNALLQIIYALNYPSGRVVVHSASRNDFSNEQWGDLQQDLFLVSFCKLQKKKKKVLLKGLVNLLTPM